VAIPLSATRDRVWSILKQHPHARYPVAERDADTISGYVTAREIVTQIIDTGEVDIAAIMREIPACYERMAAVEVLRMLQKQQGQLAVIVDEHGMTSGIVTITDIAEELLGDILDEHERPFEQVRVQPDGTYLVRADIPIQELNRALDIELAISPDYATLSGLLMHASGRIMKKGEQTSVEDIACEVIEATPRQVKWVRIRRVAPAPE
jgi:CBS domain containing-hemolysin-like protein